MSTDSIEHETRRFVGYRRSDGLGVRNHVLVLPSVICSHLVAEEIADRAGAVATPHDHGCGQLGADNDRTKRVLRNVAVNPNVAGTLVVGLGCEKVQSDALAATIADHDRPVREMTIQGAGGTDACIERGVNVVKSLTERAEGTDEPASLGRLTVGITVDGIDDPTVEYAYPLVAGLIDRIVESGGRILIAGNERFVAHPEATKAITDDAALDRFFDRHADPTRATAVYASAIDRGFEASTGFLGDSVIRRVVEYGERVDAQGVTLVDAPSRFEEAATGLAAAGAHVIVHVTSDGVPTGHPIAPVLKLSGRADTLAALPDDIDIDARKATPSDVLDRLRSVADGRPTLAERHSLTEFALARAGPSI